MRICGFVSPFDKNRQNTTDPIVIVQEAGNAVETKSLMFEKRVFVSSASGDAEPSYRCIRTDDIVGLLFCVPTDDKMHILCVTDPVHWPGHFEEDNN